MQTGNISPISQSLVLGLSQPHVAALDPAYAVMPGKVCTTFSSAALQCNAFPYTHSKLTSCLIAFPKFSLFKLKIRFGLLIFQVNVLLVQLSLSDPQSSVPGIAYQGNTGFPLSRLTF